MVEIAGKENKIDAFIDIVRPFGILEMVRSGRIAMLRNHVLKIDPTSPQESLEEVHAKHGK